MRLRCVGIVAALVAAIPIAATASDADDALRLAQRIASYRTGFPAVALHAAPRTLPSGVPLPHATLLGSVVERDRRESATPGAPPIAVALPYGSTMLFYDATDEREMVMRDYATALQSAGWRSPGNLRTRRPYVLGGFQTLLPQIEQWCAPDGRTSVITQRADDPKGIDLTIVTSRADLCGPRATTIDEQVGRPPSLPLFATVPGVTLTEAGPTMDGSTTSARIESRLGAAAVLDSFAKQLVAAGWTATSRATADGLYTQTFAKTVGRVPFVTLLCVYALDATHYVALADVAR